MMSDNDYSPVKFLRLKNGDDVISEVVEIGDEETVNYLLIYVKNGLMRKKNSMLKNLMII